MDIKLENLIERLKKEGVDGAQQASEQILEKAKQDAELIIGDAKKGAVKIIEDAENRAAKFQENTELALQQAARDAELLLKERLISLFDNVFKKEVTSILTPDFLKELILKIVAQWAENPQLEINLNEKDIGKLEKLLIQSLKGELKKSITIKPSSDIAKGFKIGLKGEDAYYDFSDNSISEMLRMFLNPKIREMLDKKNG